MTAGPSHAPTGRLGATIAILTFNGEEFLEEVLDACLSQIVPFHYEVLVVDSGSVDRTLEIVRSRPTVRLVQIPNREFGHGRTRNLAARVAAGEIVAFLTQDATPSGPTWLHELTRPLADPQVAGTYARQQPRPACCPSVKRDVIAVFQSPPPGFFSNVSSAMRRALLAQVPFRDIGYAEDQAFGSDAAAAGYRTLYVRGAVVHHSHDLALREYFRRMYDEARGVRTARGTSGPGVLWLGAAALRGTLEDWAFTVSDPCYGPAATARWLLLVPAYNAVRRLAIWLAFRPAIPPWVERRLSLERRRRAVAEAA